MATVMIQNAKKLIVKNKCELCFIFLFTKNEQIKKEGYKKPSFFYGLSANYWPSNVMFLLALNNWSEPSSDNLMVKRKSFGESACLSASL